MKRIGGWLCCAALGLAAVPGTDRIAAGFRPPRLTPGDYHLLVTLTDPADASQTTTAEFTVSPGGGG